MCGALSLQKMLSGQLALRNFLIRSREPSRELLVSSPSCSIYLGKTLHFHTPFFWDPKKLINPHVCACGITGSGKSYFVKSFVTRARLVFGARALILDWAGEYAEWVRQAGGKTISFKERGLNLLDIGGNGAHAKARQVCESLEMLTDLASFPRQRRLTEEAIESAYLSSGFSRERPAGKRKKCPTLKDVHRILSMKSKHDPEAADAARRIRSLLLTSGKSFCSSSIGMQELLSGLVCVDLHSLPTESLRSLAGLSVLKYVKENMRSEDYRSEGGISLFVVADEAWKIAQDPRSDVISIIREGRKYGFALLVASQNPSDLHPSVFSNTGTAFIFRLTHSQERETLRSSLSYSDYYEEASHFLSVGQALVHLEPSQPYNCGRDFIIEKICGEPLAAAMSIRGGGMDLVVEKEELLRRLLSTGMSDRAALGILSEFERKGFSLEAPALVSRMESAGASKSAAISLLRELGADEKGLLFAFSAGNGAKGYPLQTGVLRLKSDKGKTQMRMGGGKHAGKKRR